MENSEKIFHVCAFRKIAAQYSYRKCFVLNSIENLLPIASPSFESGCNNAS